MACSVFVIFTVSLSAKAFSASARAFFKALRMVKMEIMAPTRLPPKTTLRISLSPISILHYCLIPISFSHFWTSKLGQAFLATSLWPIIFTLGKRLWKSMT